MLYAIFTALALGLLGLDQWLKALVTARLALGLPIRAAISP